MPSLTVLSSKFQQHLDPLRSHSEIYLNLFFLELGIELILATELHIQTVTSVILRQGLGM